MVQIKCHGYWSAACLEEYFESFYYCYDLSITKKQRNQNGNEFEINNKQRKIEYNLYKLFHNQFPNKLFQSKEKALY